MFKAPRDNSEVLSPFFEEAKEDEMSFRHSFGDLDIQDPANKDAPRKKSLTVSC